ncbi:MAG: hypothetical protein J5483_01825 [Lachnospiraceae bacterium]|nr:hypothetical protein [Lachnospiraceae bacterium]
MKKLKNNPVKRLTIVIISVLTMMATFAGAALPTLAASNPSISSISASNVTTAQARVDFTTSNPGKVYVTNAGIQIRKKGTTTWTTKTDNVSKSYGTKTSIKSYYIIGSGKEVNMKLEAGVTYEFRGFIKVNNGSPIYSATKTFTVSKYTINGNGTGGISIDINAAPYATKSATAAYKQLGCTWFAACRIQQLTGKSVTIYTGSAWYNSRYADYGFTRGKTLKEKALACYGNHVLVVEKVNSDGTVIISEGGCNGWGTGAANGYCRIAKVDKKFLEETVVQYNGTFLGYVYLK